MLSLASESAQVRPEGPIAQLLPTLDIGGAERAASVLAGALAARGERVDLVVGSVRDDMACALVPPGVRLVELGTPRIRTAFRSLARYLRRERPRALIAHLTHANAIALLTRQHLGLPVRIIVVEHSTLSEFSRHSGVIQDRLLPLIARLTYRRADAVVTVSRFGRADLARITRLPEQRIKMIRTPIPFDEVALRARAQLDHPWLSETSPPMLLAVGGLGPIKDHDTLIRAFARLRERHEARLAVLGRGLERSRLERLVLKLGLSSDVSLPGMQTNPYPWISRAACVVSASRSEGLPTVLVEALMLGRAVVAVDCGGSREALDGGRLGTLTPPGDLAALAEQMERALGERARPVPADVVSAHDPDAIAAQYLELLLPGSTPGLASGEAGEESPGGCSPSSEGFVGDTDLLHDAVPHLEDAAARPVGGQVPL